MKAGPSGQPSNPVVTLNLNYEEHMPELNITVDAICHPKRTDNIVQ